MLIPRLDPDKRDREYKQRNFEEISQIVHTWLFTKVGHREMDRDILGLDPSSTRGYQSMGVLHHLGLRKEFKGIFLNSDLNQAISDLKSDEQDFSFIIELLENTSDDYGETLVESLYEVGKSRDKDFEEHYKLIPIIVNLYSKCPIFTSLIEILNSLYIAKGTDVFDF